MNSYYTFFVSMSIILSMFACGGKSVKNEQQNVAKDSVKKDTLPAKTPDTTQKETVVDSSVEVVGMAKVAKMIVNEWKVKAVLAPGKQTNAMDDQQKARMEKSSIVFKADGSQSMNVQLKKETISEEGRWKLAEEGRQVIMVSPSGKERIFKIEEITQDKLKLRAVIDMSGIVLEAKDATPSGPVKKD